MAGRGKEQGMQVPVSNLRLLAVTGEPVREIVYALPSEAFVAQDASGYVQYMSAGMLSQGSGASEMIRCADSRAAVVARLGLRYGGCQYAAEGFMVVREWWYKTRKARAHVVSTAGGAYTYTCELYDRSSEDRYNDPGEFVMPRHPDYGTSVLWALPSATAGTCRLMLTGAGASSVGDRPFMDILDLANIAHVCVVAHLHLSTMMPVSHCWHCIGQGTEAATRRVWRSPMTQHFAYVAAVLGVAGETCTALISRESPDDPPNYCIRTLRLDATDTGNNRPAGTLVRICMAGYVIMGATLQIWGRMGLR